MQELYQFSTAWHAPENVFAALADREGAIFLDSSAPAHPLSRYSILLWDPVETIVLKNQYDQDPFSRVQERLTAWCPGEIPSTGLPFCGGAAGLFSYDLGRCIEKLPELTEDTPELPDLAVGIYLKGLVYDRLEKTARFFIWAEDKESARAAFAQIPSPRDIPVWSGPEPIWEAFREKQLYLRDLEKVIDYIYAGDIFQANMARTFTAEKPPGFDPYLHYCHLRQRNPAPFGTYLNMAGTILASSSPERFLKTDFDGHVMTCPIKGTAKRHQDAQTDEKIRNNLEHSIKDRAENTMIIDLLRNDLAKTCRDASINVDKLCVLESFEGLHHLVSTITGRLRPDCTALDCMRGCFPGGSITGAPKIRAMEIIEELEPVRRGPYCGSIAYIGFDGAMDSSILIRTLIYHGDRIRLSAGGGIVADSDPETEFEETETKASKILESFATAQ